MLELFRGGGELPAGYGARLDARVVEIPWALSRLAPGRATLLDAGSSLNYDHILSAPALEGRVITILTLAPEPRCYWERGISYIYGDLRHTLFREAAFDEVTCISTAEHIGMDNAMYMKTDVGSDAPDEGGYLEAVAELRRITAPGGRLFMTVPFGRYENHGWFQQFNASMLDSAVEAFAPKRYSETIFEYGATGWRKSTRESCADCSFFDVHASRYFDPMSKVDFPPDFPAGERAVACLEMWR
ncbi:MAG TPA: methylase [Thermoleophilia bacterium]|nr:methylase [Thermoleophilia bacterium]